MKKIPTLLKMEPSSFHRTRQVFLSVAPHTASDPPCPSGPDFPSSCSHCRVLWPPGPNTCNRSTRNTLSYSSSLPHQLCSSFPRSLENGMSLWDFLGLSSWGIPAVHALPLLCPLVLCCSSVSCSLHLPQAWAETSRVLSAACPSHQRSLAEQRVRHDLSMCLGCPHTSRPVVPKIMSRGSHLLTL